MTIVYETNGQGFLGWIVEFQGAYIRGKTIEEARGKVPSELESYGKWLDLSIADSTIEKETIVQCKLHVEDADSDILLDYDTKDYINTDEFEHDCELVQLSAQKVNTLYCKCKNTDIIDPEKVRTTFYGEVYSTIRGQYEHIVHTQQYYLGCIGTRTDIESDIIEGRMRTIEMIRNKYKKDGNGIYKYYKYEEELWTIRKVMRRLIWHDRIHGRAIERMETKLEKLGIC